MLKGKVADSWVTPKLFLICSDDGKNHPLQCLVRWQVRVLGAEKVALCSFETVWKGKFHSCVGTAENAVPQVLCILCSLNYFCKTVAF